MQDKNKGWIKIVIIVSLTLLVGAGAITVVIDPYFHFHKPLKQLQYPIYDARYQNDGILKHFDYNAIIVGTSMVANFKTSEFDELFGVNSVKTPIFGAGYKESGERLATAIRYNSDITIILRCLDYTGLLLSADYTGYNEDLYPEYLYDDILWNDVNYIFNKTVFLEATQSVIKYNLEGRKTTSFDDYSKWQDEETLFGKEVVDATYVRSEKSSEIISITEEDYQTIKENITQNVTNLAKENPEIEFYLFFPPYSIYYWNDLYCKGTMERQLAAEKYIIELLLEYDNIHLFSFFTEYEMICDLNNYMDRVHYSKDINSQILIWIKEGTHELTLENYKEYCNQMKDFYMNYDYDGLFEN